MKVSLIKHMFLCMLVAVQFCSCNEEDFEEKYGSGSPLAENVMPLDGYIYEYNEQGLVTKISSIDTKKDENGKETTELVTIATISYPSAPNICLNARRPIRPKPFIATLTAIIYSSYQDTLS